MGAEKVKFRVNDKKTGASSIVSLADLYGYEGILEGCGIRIRYDAKHVDERLKGKFISFNSGYAYKGMNPDFDFEPVKED